MSNSNSEGNDVLVLVTVKDWVAFALYEETLLSSLVPKTYILVRLSEINSICIS